MDSQPPGVIDMLKYLFGRVMNTIYKIYKYTSSSIDIYPSSTAICLYIEILLCVIQRNIPLHCDTDVLENEYQIDKGQRYNMSTYCDFTTRVVICESDSF